MPSQGAARSSDRGNRLYPHRGDRRLAFVLWTDSFLQGRQEYAPGMDDAGINPKACCDHGSLHGFMAWARRLLDGEENGGGERFSELR
jgi:hypothetical protein